jgi:membrane protein implicated in regulation of membrane protease activity
VDRDGHGDRNARRPASTGSGGLRLHLKVALALGVVVLAASMAFVLVYATDLSWPSALLISAALAGAQVYAIRRSLFRGGGHDDGADS